MDYRATLQAVLGAVEDGVIVIDTSGRVIAFNRAAEALTGWSATDATGQPVTTVLRGVERARPDPRSPLPAESHRAVERSIIARDGARKRIRQLTVPLTDESGRPQGELLVVSAAGGPGVLDAHLLDPEKLDSVGLLAGGIAHDFNNVLAALLNNITLAKMASTRSDPVFPRLADLERITLRAQGLTRQLLTFARGGEPAKRPVDVRQMLEQAAGSGARSELSLPDDLWAADCDIGQIAHAVGAIVMNAAEAMTPGAVVQISAENVTATAETAFPPTPGRYVRLSFRDRGAGIPAEHLSKVFDPYFTTKPNRGGLGLPSVYSIMKKHEGYIDVESDVGVGTTFHLYLSASDFPPAAVDATSLADTPTRPLTILLMDDDDEMRQSAGDLLSRLGHTVTVARDGGEAVALYETALAAGMPFDAVILDLTVTGGVGGQETIRKLRALDPEVKALLSSGYSNDEVVTDFAKYGFRGVLPKPYRLVDLRKAIERVART
ncbi:MAG: hybrid sensor histidine kinase/response regulator [Candidatus Rokuibacteriota bacterium]|nr:MAG: hybrid sensor histidine kinase/response regulator [Candidatus Rokubacteria bacterium]